MWRIGYHDGGFSSADPHRHEGRYRINQRQIVVVELNEMFTRLRSVRVIGRTQLYGRGIEPMHM